MLMSGEQLDVFPSFKEGTAVRVKHGPLSGIVGILAKREDSLGVFELSRHYGRSKRSV